MWKASEKLKIGDKVSTWWQPEGATLLRLRPYTGPFDFVLSIGEFSAPANKSGRLEMSLLKGWQHEIME